MSTCAPDLMQFGSDAVLETPDIIRHTNSKGAGTATESSAGVGHLESQPLTFGSISDEFGSKFSAVQVEFRQTDEDRAMTHDFNLSAAVSFIERGKTFRDASKVEKKQNSFSKEVKLNSCAGKPIKASVNVD